MNRKGGVAAIWHRPNKNKSGCTDINVLVVDATPAGYYVIEWVREFRFKIATAIVHPKNIELLP